MFEKLLEYDKNLFLQLNGLGAESYDTFWTFITNTTTWIPLFVFFFILVYRNSSQKQLWVVVVFVLLALLVNLGFTELIKEWVARLRPNNDLTISKQARILIFPENYSFFSGHASSSFTVTVFLYLWLRKKVKFAGLLFIWPFLFCSSRIYVGVHYPSDILVGSVFGMFMGSIFYYFNRYWLNKQNSE